MMHWLITGGAAFAAWHFTKGQSPLINWGVTLAVAFFVWGFMAKQNGGE